MSIICVIKWMALFSACNLYCILYYLNEYLLYEYNPSRIVDGNENLKKITFNRERANEVTDFIRHSYSIKCTYLSTYQHPTQGKICTIPIRKGLTNK